MRIRSILGALVIAAMPFTSVWAENMTPEDIKKLVDEAVTNGCRNTSTGKAATGAWKARGTDWTIPSRVGPLPEVGWERRGEEKAASVFRLHRFRPAWSMPSRLSQRRRPLSAAIWTFSIVPEQKASIENGYGGNTNGFDQQRFVPFIYADITEHVKFASEIEIEHGIRRRRAMSTEIGLEFALYRLSRQRTIQRSRRNFAAPGR